MKIQEAYEKQIINIPIKEVIGLDGEINIREEARKYFDIDYRPSSGIFSLKAGGMIGLLPLNNNFAVEIKPKFPISNLIHIIDRSGEQLNSLDFFYRNYKEIADSSPTIFIFYVKCLIKELRYLSSEGVLKSYFLKSDHSSKLKGRISFSKTIRHHWSRGIYSKASFEYFDYSIDNEINRMIKHTIWYCLNALSERKADDKLISDLYEYYLLLEPASSDFNYEYINVVRNNLAALVIPSIRNYYYEIYKICRLILDNAGVSVSKTGGDINLSSFCIDMAITFERYILNTFRNNDNLLSNGALVLDGNNEGMRPLFNKQKTHIARPDMVFIVSGKCKIIADVKYKPKVVASDRYQVITHAFCYGASSAILIMPSEENGKTGLHRIGEIGEAAKVVLYEYHFDLSQGKLLDEEVKLVSEVSKLL